MVPYHMVVCMYYVLLFVATRAQEGCGSLARTMDHEPVTEMRTLLAQTSTVELSRPQISDPSLSAGCAVKPTVSQPNAIIPHSCMSFPLQCCRRSQRLDANGPFSAFLSLTCRRLTNWSAPTCSCTDRHGNRKTGYKSYMQAWRHVDRAIRKRPGKVLHIHECPHFYNVWHLTSNTPFTGGDLPRLSKTCRGAHTGEFLLEYHSPEEAREGARYSWKRYKHEMIFYRCKTCDLWHCAPRTWRHEFNTIY